MKQDNKTEYLSSGWKFLLLAVAICLTIPCLIMMYYQILNITGFSLIFFVVAICEFVTFIWFFALNKSKNKAEKGLSCLLFGFILGALGFLFGYFTPIYLTKSNIGPLTGFFISGPIGFILGTIVRMLYLVKLNKSI